LFVVFRIRCIALSFLLVDVSFLRQTGYALFWMDIITMFGQSRSAGLAAEKRLLFMVIRKTCLEFRRCCERIKKGKIGIVDGVCMSVLYKRYRVMITHFNNHAASWLLYAMHRRTAKRGAVIYTKDPTPLPKPTSTCTIYQPPRAPESCLCLFIGSLQPLLSQPLISSHST